MAEFIYYLFNLCVAVPITILGLRSRVQLFTRWRHLLRAYICVSVPFIIWDMWAAWRGHWLFSERFITAPRIVGIPVEEILFFFTVPLAMMFVWLVIGVYVAPLKIRYSHKTLRVAVWLSALCFFAASLAAWGREYTMCATIIACVTSCVLASNAIISERRFWYFQLCAVVLFLVFNTFLTALPVISYGADSIIGLKIGTIPLEDFLYNYALLNLFLVVFNRERPLTKST